MPRFGNEIFNSLNENTSVKEYVSFLEKKYKKYGQEIPKIIDNDPYRNKWETTPNAGNNILINNQTFQGNFTGNVTDSGKVNFNWGSELEAKMNKLRDYKNYNVKENRWWYVTDEKHSTYTDSVQPFNSSNPTLFVYNTSVNGTRTMQYPIGEQPDLTNALQRIYENYEFGPNEFNDSLSPYQITHNEFGIKTNWGILRNPDSDERRYEKRVVRKNILISQGTSILEGVSGLFGVTIPISLSNFDTTGAGVQSALLFTESFITNTASGMGMVGSLAMNALSKNLGFPTNSSYGLLRPSDSVVHNRYTVDGKGINQGLFNSTPFGIGETIKDIVTGGNIFESIGSNLNLEIPGLNLNKDEGMTSAHPLFIGMKDYYSVLSYAQIKMLQIDTTFGNKRFIDFRDFITDGKAWFTQTDKDRPILLNSPEQTDRNILNFGKTKATSASPSVKSTVEEKLENPISKGGEASAYGITETGPIDYSTFNPETRFGMAALGRPGLYRKNFTRMQESLEYGTYDAFNLMPIEQVDDVKNISPYARVDDNKKYRDYIKFTIYDVANKELMRLRATIADVSEAVTPNWEASEYVGKADPVFTYKATQRKFSFSFTMYSNSRVEFLPMWRKINKLYGLMYPTYKDDILFDGKGNLKGGENIIEGNEDLTYEQRHVLSQRYGETYTSYQQAVSSSAEMSGSGSQYGEVSQSISEMKQRNKQERKMSYFMNKGRPIAPFILLTLGDWFNNEPGFLTELSVSVDNNYPWEINLENDLWNVAQLPHLIRISTGFQPIGKDLFENGANFFGWGSIGTKHHIYQDPNYQGRLESEVEKQKVEEALSQGVFIG